MIHPNHRLAESIDYQRSPSYEPNITPDYPNPTPVSLKPQEAEQHAPVYWLKVLYSQLGFGGLAFQVRVTVRVRVRVGLEFRVGF